jgi:ParB/RepB/Spo0J family partition protein
MEAIDKTQTLGRLNLPTDQLEGNPNNPNEMSDQEFNLLCDNIEKMGLTDPILVRPLPSGKYRIVGGHHRWEVAKLLGFKDVPCTVVTDPAFDEDQEAFQLVRMNTIRGHLSPQKFIQMYQSLAPKYADEVMQESFGFASEEEFQKLLVSVKKTLPKELQTDFTKAATELKTIDDLSKLLNRLFMAYGNTLPFGYMLMDFGGKDSVWLRMEAKTRKDLLQVCKTCVMQNRTVDDIIGGLLRMAASGRLADEIAELVKKTPQVLIPEGVTVPTKEVLEGTMKDLLTQAESDLGAHS